MDEQTAIAIVGFAYRAPGVGGKGLWEFLAESKSAWSPVPADRFDQDAFYHHDPEKPGCVSSRGAHFLPDDIYAFDAAFFNLTPDEAHAMDPQHRLLLECAVEAAEAAGIRLNDLAGTNMGVFAAHEISEYAQLLGEDLPTTSKYMATGTGACMFANRLSYFFDLSGPSVSVDAACASSTIALHLACQSLRSGECNTAFVGAASLIISPHMMSVLDTMGALSPEGKCFSYDTKASGFGRGEGGVCLVVKRLSDAITCGDPIRAVIRNTVTSHCGRTKGITMPSQAAQEELLLHVHQAVGLDPGETAFVEGHGTGTQVGDPIDAGAIASVVGRNRTPSNPVHIGSLKSNFGHLISASGLLAVVKAIMMIERGYMLPNASFEELNPNIEGREKLRVVGSATPWPPHAPKRVCVTNFGFGGSNAAVILEQHNSALQISNPKAGHVNGYGSETRGTQETNGLAKGHKAQWLFAFSAKSEGSLMTYCSSFLEYLDGLDFEMDSRELLKNLSFTLGQRRSHFPYRVAATADSLHCLQEQLSSLFSIKKSSKTKDSVIAFVFTGQGAQYAQMAAGLQRYKPFATAIIDAEEYIWKFGALWSLTEELNKPKAESRINDAEISQPACTAIQLALVVLLRAWGVKPAVVSGHSSGEIAATFTAGFISFETAMAVAYFRGQVAAQMIQDQRIRGAMVAVGTSEEEATTLLHHKLNDYASIAAINSPRSVTISGDESAVKSVEQAANAKGLFMRHLNVDVAYHSHHMVQVATSYLKLIQPFCDRDFHASAINSSNAVFISSVTGRKESKDAVDARYWVSNLVSPVRFLDSITSALSTKVDHSSSLGVNGQSTNVIVEIGPHSALKSPINQTLESIHEQADSHCIRANYLPSLVRDTDAEKAILDLAGSLFAMGSDIQFEELNQSTHTNALIVTDLPSYEWNKAATYKHVSRIADRKLHPGQPYSPLLGWKSAYDEGNEHSFRLVFSLDEIPWIRDHKLSRDIVFPLTGYIAMAIGALRAVNQDPLLVVLLRDVHVKRGLTIAEDESVDITTKLRPAETGTENVSSTVWAFEIVSWSKRQGWTTHCYGQVEPDTRKMSMESPVMSIAASTLSSDELVERDAQCEYNELRDAGLVYGPLFATMTRLWEAPGKIVHETQLRKLESFATSPHDSPVTVDAPTLDSFLHAVFIAHGGSSEAREVFMPNYFSRLRISNQTPAGTDQKFTIVTRRLDRDRMASSMRLSIAVFAASEHSPIPVLEIDSISLRCVAERIRDDSMAGLPNGYFQQLVPHLDFIDNHELAKTLADTSFDEQELQQRQKLNEIGVHFMTRALREAAKDDSSELPPHLSKFLSWAKRVTMERSSNGGTQLAPAFIEQAAALVPGMSTSGAQGAMLCAVGEHLPAILRREVEPLEIMLKDGLLARNYEQDAASIRGNAALARYARCLSDTNSNMNVLEIGGGTASATLGILEAMSRDAQEAPAFLHYTFTDISSGFFDNARTKLAKWSDRISYQKLDIGQDPTQQGFTAHAYDCVAASNVLHATPNIVQTINHVRTLLKPKGKLLLYEVVEHQPCYLPFSLLPGWWLAEDDYRLSDGPLLSEEAWNHLLTANGFSGIDGAIADYPHHPVHLGTAMWSTKMDGQEVSRDKTPIVVCGDLTDGQGRNFAELVSRLVYGRLGCATSTQPLAEFNALDSPFCIFIDGFSHSTLANVSSSTFRVLKKIFLETAGLLWVVPETSGPEAMAIKGFLRTLRLEDPSKSLLLLENSAHSSRGASEIAAVAARVLVSEPTNHMDQDLVLKEGVVHVPRLVSRTAVKETFAWEAGMPVKSNQTLFQSNDALEMTADVAASPDSLYFRKTNVLSEELDDDQIVVKVEAAGVNFRDLLLVLGSIPWTRPGLEGAGMVMRVGSQVTTVKPGDRVFYISNEGGFASHVQIPGVSAHRIPNDLSAADAATIPIAYSTAIMCLIPIGRLTKGESVLIHAASGAVGQACIVIAQHLGAQVFATAGSPEKRAFLHKNFHIPETHIFSSRTAVFVDGVLRGTRGKGVEVVVNSLSGDLLRETWSLIADFGRFIEIGRKDFLSNSHLGMRNFDRNVTFTGLDLYKFFTQRPATVGKCLSDIDNLLRRKIIAPIRPTTTIPSSQIGMALRKLQGGRNLGKIVITMNDNDSVLAEVTPPLSQVPYRLLRSDATYLITGGTGGIGRSLASWMLDNGAKNVLLLGRSGANRTEVAELLKRYEGSGVCLRAVTCDVGSQAELAQALKAIEDLPKVRGVIHGALYLRDAMFANSSYEDWQKITAPKIQGAWNLHELVHDLDFFISLSSVVGTIGHFGQAIYGGTATFLDSFSDYRLKLGLPAVSISLPVVEGVGYVASRGINESAQRTIGLSLTETDVHLLIKGAIAGPSSGLNVNGKVFATRPPMKSTDVLHWEQASLCSALRRAPMLRKSDDNSADSARTSLRKGNHSSVDLLDFLTDKVSSMTLIDREELRPQRPLGDYGLDSLVSVELRNWIRRETGVELILPQIAGAENLNALVEMILSQKQ